ncbi:hypothetical protein Tco_1177196 [Tanacetum coccineum]
MVHEGFKYRVRNEEGRMITEFAAAHSFFKKRDACLIIFIVGTTTLRLTICWCAEDTLGRSCTTKMEIKPRILWMNLYGEATTVLRTRVTEGVATEVEGRTFANTEQMWNNIAHTIREATKET